MDLIYLDYNCFQRGFDDPRQIRIQLEALACQEIFFWAERGKLKLIWSFMHQDETIICPFPDRKYEVFRLALLCQVTIGPHPDVLRQALSLQKKGNLSAKDAVHLACAASAKADVFLTCDDQVVKKSRKLKLKFQVMNPVDYITEVIGNEKNENNG